MLDLRPNPQPNSNPSLDPLNPLTLSPSTPTLTLTLTLTLALTQPYGIPALYYPDPHLPLTRTLTITPTVILIPTLTRTLTSTHPNVHHDQAMGLCSQSSDCCPYSVSDRGRDKYLGLEGSGLGLWSGAKVGARTKVRGRLESFQPTILSPSVGVRVWEQGVH